MDEISEVFWSRIEFDLILTTDGACRGNPGEGAVAFVIRNSVGKVLERGARTIGHCTNNFAEYNATIDGLIACAKYSDGNVKHITDSRLVAGQLGLNWKVNSPNLRPLHQKAKLARAKFKLVVHCSVKREDGRIQEADAMLNDKLDAA